MRTKTCKEGDLSLDMLQMMSVDDAYWPSELNDYRITSAVIIIDGGPIYKEVSSLAKVSSNPKHYHDFISFKFDIGDKALEGTEEYDALLTVLSRLENHRNYISSTIHTSTCASVRFQIPKELLEQLF